MGSCKCKGGKKGLKLCSGLTFSRLISVRSVVAASVWAGDPADRHNTRIPRLTSHPAQSPCPSGARQNLLLGLWSELGMVVLFMSERTDSRAEKSSVVCKHVGRGHEVRVKVVYFPALQEMVPIPNTFHLEYEGQTSQGDPFKVNNRRKSVKNCSM